MTRIFSACAIALLLSLAMGCSGSGGNPVTPDTTPDEPQLTGAAQSDITPDPSPGHNMLGFWECVVDPDSGMIEFIPLRASEFHFNLVTMLEGAVMNISLVDPPTFSGGILTANIALSHPLPGVLNLSGFDVKGVLISNGSVTGFTDPDIKIAGPNQTRLANPDGYTRWWNPAEFTRGGFVGYSPGRLGSNIDPENAAILNGYKLYADGFAMADSMSDLDPASRAFFEAASGTNARTYQISLAGGLHFNYAVDASWKSADPNPPQEVPDDFPIEANQPEPYWIEVDEFNNTLWYADDDCGGNVNYYITVHDWQGIDDFGIVTVESPGVFTLTATEPVSETANGATFRFDAVNPPLTSTNPLDVLISVAVSGDYAPALTGVDKPLKAYQLHVSDISDEAVVINIPPVPLMHATTPTEIMIGESVSFDATASYDPDGRITHYFWDFNGDSVYSDIYEGEPTTPTYTFNEAGEFEVKLKVRDNMTGSTISDPVIVNVTAEANDPPVAVAEATTSTHIDEDQTISFDGSASYDPDGTVVEWQWDFDGDGDYSDEFTGDMQTPTALFPDPGTYYVDLKVIDDGSGFGVLEEKIEVTIDDIPNIPPVAIAITTTSTEIDCCEPISFDASGSYDDDGTIEEYNWDFNGDGTFGDPYNSGTGVNPTKIYGDAGVYEVSLQVVDNEGDSDTTDTPIVVTVTNVPPIASAVATTPTEIFTLDSVSFDASDSEDPDCDEIVLFEWDFDGDGTFGDPYDSGNDRQPTVLYPDMGTFNVMLRVHDEQGDTDDIDEPIVVTVSPHPPTACAVITSTPPFMEGTQIELSGSCSDDFDGDVVSWEWDMNADGSYEKTGETVSFTVGTWDLYQIQLRVTDDDAQQDLLDEPIEFWAANASHMPPVVSMVHHSRTTSLRGSTTETVELSVDFTDDAPPGDFHTYLWMCPYGSFDDETSPTPVWTPPSEVVECDITCRVIDSEGMWGEGTCQQWVTQWPVLTNNPNAVDGCMIIPEDLEDALSDNWYDPADYKFPDVGPNGNVVYINWWATWCGYCIAEMPLLDEIYNMYKDEDYVHLHINKGESKATAANWINTHSYEATYWLLDPTSAYFNLTNNWNGDSGGIPQHLVFDRDGRCRGNRVGSIQNTGIEPIDRYLRELI